MCKSGNTKGERIIEIGEEKSELRNRKRKASENYSEIERERKVRKKKEHENQPKINIEKFKLLGTGDTVRNGCMTTKNGKAGENEVKKQKVKKH